jgi:hypothetical protein
MAYASPYGHVFDIPVVRPARKRATTNIFRDRTHADLIDLEFSEYGRDPRFVAGWFILPGVALGMAIVAALILLL